MEANRDGVFIIYDEMKGVNPEHLIAQAKSRKTFYSHLVEYWKNGSYFTYDDERTKALGENFTIRVNNDGSEDLVQIHFDDEKSWFTKVERITPPGEAPLWKKTIQKGFMTPQEIKQFEHNPEFYK